jgi:phosphatidylinositol alpha-1,6-mannosyltransferase
VSSSIVVAFTGASATAGGIAAVNRNVLCALSALADEYSFRLSALSFLEKEFDRPTFLPASVRFRCFQSDKLRFAFAILRHVVTCPLFVFDHVTLAKPLLPLIATQAVRAVILAHGSEAWKRIRPVNRWIFANATLVLTNSEFTLKKMRNRIPRFNGVACPLGLAPEFPSNIEPPISRPESLSSKNSNGEMCSLGSRVCLLVGRMHPDEREKGHYELLKVWAEIVREFPEAQLVFIGPGEDQPNIERVARESGVGNSVFVPGEVSQETLRTLYGNCYAFTMPSRQEGFGLVYLEAMNFAKPCLGCRDGGAEDVIVDGETGLLINNPIDLGELVAALRRLLRNHDAAREMGRRGFERLHKHFTAAHYQQRLREQFMKIL